MKAKKDQDSEPYSEIYSKALDLFVKNGFDATPMSMIAKALGMSKATLYYYCSSKENLLYRMHMHYLKKHFIPIFEEAEQMSDPEDRIAFLIRKIALINTSSSAARVLIHEIHSLNKKHIKEINLIWRRVYKLFSTAIRELQLSGKARKSRKSFLTFIALSMVNWIVYWFDYSRQAHAGELADTLIQNFLHGLLYPNTAKR
jgi:AcrR family transcriptional regulator